MEDVHRNILISCICGTVFGVAWWIMIDILAYYPRVNSYKYGIVYLPITLSTISIFINGLIPSSSLVDNFVVSRTIFLHRLVFFLSMTLAFGGVLSAILISVLRDDDLPVYAVVGIPFINFLILAVNLTFKFALVEDADFLY